MGTAQPLYQMLPNYKGVYYAEMYDKNILFKRRIVMHW